MNLPAKQVHPSSAVTRPYRPERIPRLPYARRRSHVRINRRQHLRAPVLINRPNHGAHLAGRHARAAPRQRLQPVHDELKRALRVEDIVGLPDGRVAVPARPREEHLVQHRLVVELVVFGGEGAARLLLELLGAHGLGRGQELRHDARVSLPGAGGGVDGLRRGLARAFGQRFAFLRELILGSWLAGGEGVCVDGHGEDGDDGWRLHCDSGFKLLEGLTAGMANDVPRIKGQPRRRVLIRGKLDKLARLRVSNRTVLLLAVTPFLYALMSLAYALVATLETQQGQ